jgi:hemerythrin-like domain-containing protein
MEFIRTHEVSSSSAANAATLAYRGFFDQPCTILVNLATYIPQRGMDRAAREVAGRLCSYFDDEFGRHRKDQESGLFPDLRARARSEDVAFVDETIGQLIAEHLSIDHSWKQLREALRDIASCRPAKLSAADVARFATLYSDHIASEDERLIPLLARIVGLEGNMEIGPVQSRSRLVDPRAD